MPIITGSIHSQARLFQYQRYPLSLDKGYHSPANQQRLAELADLLVLPKKGMRLLTKPGAPTNLR